MSDEKALHPRPGSCIELVVHNCDDTGDVVARGGCHERSNINDDRGDNVARSGCHDVNDDDDNQAQGGFESFRNESNHFYGSQNDVHAGNPVREARQALSRKTSRSPFSRIFQRLPLLRPSSCPRLAMNTPSPTTRSTTTASTSPLSTTLSTRTSSTPSALWSGSTKNRDVSTGSLAHPFAHSLVMGKQIIRWLFILCSFFYFGP